MNRFTDNDFNALEQKISTSKVVRLADVQDRIEKVAFDVVRFQDNDGLDRLWQIQSTPEGDVLVAMYEEEDDQLETKKGHWQAVSDRDDNVNVFYKGDPIVRFATKDFGIPTDDTKMVCRYLPEKLANDQNFAASLLKDLPEKERTILFEKYPELKG